MLSFTKAGGTSTLFSEVRHAEFAFWDPSSDLAAHLHAVPYTDVQAAVTLHELLFRKRHCAVLPL